MQLYELLLVSVMVAIFMVAGMGEGQADSIFRKPVPAGVVEITGISAGGGIVELKDGSLMLAQGSSYHLSADGRGLIVFVRSRDKARTPYKLTTYGSQRAQAGEVNWYW